MNTETKIELTPAELELIRIKRDKDALEAKEKAAQAAIRLEKEIASKKEEVKKFVLQHTTHNRVAEEYLIDLNKINPGKYSIQLFPKKQQFDIYHWGDKQVVDQWRTRKARETNASAVEIMEESHLDDNKIYDFKEIVEYNDLRIVCGVMNNDRYPFEIEIEQHGRTAYRWKMEFNGEHYLNAKTLDARIEEKSRVMVMKKKELEEKNKGMQWTLQAVNEKYANKLQTVELKKEWRSSHSSGYEVEFVYVVFKNNTTAEFSFTITQNAYCLTVNNVRKSDLRQDQLLTLLINL